MSDSEDSPRGAASEIVGFEDEFLPFEPAHRSFAAPIARVVPGAVPFMTAVGVVVRPIVSVMRRTAFVVRGSVPIMR
jgi:hypothetical protein